MSISDLFNSGFQKRNQDHFASIVRVAKSGGEITNEEKSFLDRLALNLNISEDNYKEILKDYMSHPINPPTSYTRRIERLYDLSRMVYVDHHLGDKQTLLLEKLSIGLGFTPKNATHMVHKALALVKEGVDFDTFVDEIRNF